MAGACALFDADGRLTSANARFDQLLPRHHLGRGPEATLDGVLAGIGERGGPGRGFGYLDTPEEPAWWLPAGDATERSRDWQTPEGLWFRVHVRRLPSGWLLDAAEITDFKRQEKDLAEARGRLQTVLDHMTDGVMMWDEDLRVVFANNGAIRVGEFPEGAVYPGASVVDLVRLRERRGDYGSLPESEAELERRVAARVAMLTRPAAPATSAPPRSAAGWR